MRRQQSQRQFPHDPPLGIGEVVELVHDDGGDVAEVEREGSKFRGSEVQKLQTRAPTRPPTLLNPEL